VPSTTPAGSDRRGCGNGRASREGSHRRDAWAKPGACCPSSAPQLADRSARHPPAPAFARGAPGCTASVAGVRGAVFQPRTGSAESGSPGRVVSPEAAGETRWPSRLDSSPTTDTSAGSDVASFSLAAGL
jgi:hypothetical protein